MKPVIAVQDANILIDCADMQILDAVFALPFHFMTTDLIWAEITTPHNREALNAHIQEGKLTVTSLDSEALEAIIRLEQEQTGLSLQDCSAWYCAEQGQGMLLTGDGALRKKARKAGLTVHGSLWVLQQVRESNILDRAACCQALQYLKKMNPRLPQKEMARLEKEWCSEGNNDKQ
jgi:predicted nucleic acid-binding protein